VDGAGSVSGSGAGAGSTMLRARKRRSLPVDVPTVKVKGRASGGKTWDKARWEAEWGERLSADVARRLREEEEDEKLKAALGQSDHYNDSLSETGNGNGAVKAPSTSESPRTHRSRRSSTHSTSSSQRSPAQRPTRRRRLSSFADPSKKPSPQVDPLHLPSLLLMSLSLLRPMQARLVRAVAAFSGRLARDGCVQVALVGGFCVGVGVGVVLGGVVGGGSGGEW